MRLGFRMTVMILPLGVLLSPFKPTSAVLAPLLPLKLNSWLLTKRPNDPVTIRRLPRPPIVIGSAKFLLKKHPTLAIRISATSAHPRSPPRRLRLEVTQFPCL